MTKEYRTCKWCKRNKKPQDPPGKLCKGCRARADKGLGPVKIDALDRRLPGSFGTGKRR